MVHWLRLDRRSVEDRLADVLERVIEGVNECMQAGGLAIAGQDNALAGMLFQILGERLQPAARFLRYMPALLRTPTR